MNRIALLILIAGVACAQDPRKIIEESQNRSRSKSQKYEGTLEVVDARNKVATKRWEYLRIGSFGDSKSVLRFTDPPEVKGVALLVFNHPERASDQWMWRPEIGRDQRIALQDRSTRFFGTDFSFEDLQERDVDQFDYKLSGQETLDGAAAWKIEARPRQATSSQYTYTLLWVRKDNLVAVQVEGYNKNGLARRTSYRDLQNIQNIWTARTIEVFDVSRKSRTVLKLDKLEYNLPLKEADFTLQALRRGA